jgi:hypothetical protein
MERIEDRSKALSYIGIEVADALKVIPTPVDIDSEETVVENANVTEEQTVAENVVAAVEQKEEKQEQVSQEQTAYIAETRVEVKPSLWQRIKSSKIGKAIGYIFKIRVVLDVPVLPEGRGE